MDGAVPVEVYNTNGDAKLALSNGEIDALVADLPTAFAVANELRDGLMVGQLPTDAGDVEQFGIVLDKDSPLTRCVSSAVDALRDDGTLAALQNSVAGRRGKGAGARASPRPARAPATQQACVGLVPGVLVGRRAVVPRPGPGGAGTPCSLKTVRVRAVTGRAPSVDDCSGGALVRRAAGDDDRRGEDRGQPNPAHQPTNLVSRADRCGTSPPSASTRSST